MLCARRAPTLVLFAAALLSACSDEVAAPLPVGEIHPSFATSSAPSMSTVRWTFYCTTSRQLPDGSYRYGLIRIPFSMAEVEVQAQGYRTGFKLIVDDGAQRLWAARCNVPRSLPAYNKVLARLGSRVRLGQPRSSGRHATPSLRGRVQTTTTAGECEHWYYVEDDPGTDGDESGWYCGEIEPIIVEPPPPPEEDPPPPPDDEPTPPPSGEQGGGDPPPPPQDDIYSWAYFNAGPADISDQSIEDDDGTIELSEETYSPKCPQRLFGHPMVILAAVAGAGNHEFKWDPPFIRSKLRLNGDGEYGVGFSESTDGWWIITSATVHVSCTGKYTRYAPGKRIWIGTWTAIDFVNGKVSVQSGPNHPIRSSQ